MAHLDEHKLLSDKQHTFRKWHSSETQLAAVINDWAKSLDNKGQVYRHFQLNFEKAFTVGLLVPGHFYFYAVSKFSLRENDISVVLL